MKNCYTTKAYAEAYDKLTEDELRSGKLNHETRTVSNESGTIEVNCTNNEIEDFHMVSDATDDEIDSDVTTDENMERLIQFLEEEDMLEVISEPDRARCPRCGIPTVPDHEDLKPEAATCNECHALGQHSLPPWAQSVGDDDIQIISHAEGEGLIADVNCYGNSAKGKANARLIAAAPELLAALQSLVRCVPEERNGYVDSVDWEDAMYELEQARAVIAKATAITHPTE